MNSFQMSVDERLEFCGLTHEIFTPEMEAAYNGIKMTEDVAEQYCRKLGYPVKVWINLWEVSEWD